MLTIGGLVGEVTRADIVTSRGQSRGMGYVLSLLIISYAIFRSRDEK